MRNSLGALPSVALSPGTTSYYSKGETFLDPRLFEGRDLRGDVRESLLQSYHGFMGGLFHGSESWSHVWLAGSGASYQWSASRDPSDLDMLVGVDFPLFKMMNFKYSSLTSEEISRVINHHLKNELSPSMKGWGGGFEPSWYVNPRGSDIRALKPYAAYSLTDKAWTVEPVQSGMVPRYSSHADKDLALTKRIISRYTRASGMLSRPDLDHRVRQTYQTSLEDSLKMANALFEEIHGARSGAFGDSGQGYADEANARWQAGKESGAIPALKVLRDVHRGRTEDLQSSQYGVPLRPVDDLLLESLTYMDER